MLKHLRNATFLLFAVGAFATVKAGAMPDPCDPQFYIDTQCTSNCIHEPVANYVCPDPTAFCNTYCAAGELVSSEGSYCFQDSFLCGWDPYDPDPPLRVHCECEAPQ